ncbi:MAG: GNAT family N-acetyltransferase [Alphaproteobacteria bacterium]
MNTNNQVTYNEAQKRYEMAVEGHTVYANVRKEKDVLYIDYVYAPPELRGTGAAGRFMDELMKVVRAENMKAVPICGYAASWLTRHSEYNDLVTQN